MPKYKVNVICNRSFPGSSGEIQFEAANDDEARKYLKELESGWIDPNKRGLEIDYNTLSPVLAKKPRL